MLRGALGTTVTLAAAFLGLWLQTAWSNHSLQQALRQSVTYPMPGPLPETIVAYKGTPLTWLSYLDGRGIKSVVFRPRPEQVRNPLPHWKLTTEKIWISDYRFLNCVKCDPRSQVSAELPDEYLEFLLGRDTSAAKSGLAHPFVGGPFELWHVTREFERLVAAGGPQFKSDRDIWGRHGENHSNPKTAENIKAFLLEVLPLAPRVAKASR